MKHNQTDIIRAISSGIIECALFADKPEGSNPRVTRQAIQAAEAIAAQFVGIVGDELMNQAVGAYDWVNVERPEFTPTQCIGHDIWFTLQGHGMGFWDRDFLKQDKYGEDITLGQTLTEACRKLKHVEPLFYRGWLYIE